MKRKTAPSKNWITSLSLSAALALTALTAGAQPPPLPATEELVAPIALYPDPLIALVLPAATHPDQVEWAARHPAFDSAEPSVQILEQHFPQVLRWLAANLPWTEQLGAAFAADPAAIMQAIQDLRRTARANGTLGGTAYDRLVVDPNGDIEILPDDSGMIYVPGYDPDLVFYSQGPIDWGEPIATGPWIGFAFDWRGGAIRYDSRPWHPPAHVEVTGQTPVNGSVVRRPPIPLPLRPPPNRAPASTPSRPGTAEPNKDRNHP